MFWGGAHPHRSLLRVLGLPDVLLDEPVVADQPRWAGMAIFHVQEEGCEEEQPWGDRVTLGTPLWAASAQGSDNPSPQLNGGPVVEVRGEV